MERPTNKEIAEELGRAVTAWAERMLESSKPVAEPAAEEDTLTSMEEAAKKLHVSKTFLYQNKDDFPFIIRLPHGQFRASRSKLREYIETNTRLHFDPRRSRIR